MPLEETLNSELFKEGDFTLRQQMLHNEFRGAADELDPAIPEQRELLGKLRESYDGLRNDFVLRDSAIMIAKELRAQGKPATPEAVKEGMGRFLDLTSRPPVPEKEINPVNGRYQNRHNREGDPVNSKTMNLTGRFRKDFPDSAESLDFLLNGMGLYNNRGFEVDANERMDHFVAETSVGLPDVLDVMNNGRFNRHKSEVQWLPDSKPDRLREHWRPVWENYERVATEKGRARPSSFDRVRFTNDPSLAGPDLFPGQEGTMNTFVPRLRGQPFEIKGPFIENPDRAMDPMSQIELTKIPHPTKELLEFSYIDKAGNRDTKIIEGSRGDFAPADIHRALRSEFDNMSEQSADEFENAFGDPNPHMLKTFFNAVGEGLVVPSLQGVAAIIERAGLQEGGQAMHVTANDLAQSFNQDEPGVNVWSNVIGNAVGQITSMIATGGIAGAGVKAIAGGARLTKVARAIERIRTAGTGARAASGSAVPGIEVASAANIAAHVNIAGQQMFGEVYWEALEHGKSEGMTEAKARTAATQEAFLFASIGSVLEFFPAAKFSVTSKLASKLRRASQGFIKRYASGGAIESGTETAQELWGLFIEDLSRHNNALWKELNTISDGKFEESRLAQSAIGGLAGGVAGTTIIGAVERASNIGARPEPGTSGPAPDHVTADPEPDPDGTTEAEPTAEPTAEPEVEPEDPAEPTQPVEEGTALVPVEGPVEGSGPAASEEGGPILLPGEETAGPIALLEPETANEETPQIEAPSEEAPSETSETSPSEETPSQTDETSAPEESSSEEVAFAPEDLAVVRDFAERPLEYNENASEWARQVSVDRQAETLAAIDSEIQTLTDKWEAETDNEKKTDIALDIRALNLQKTALERQAEKDVAIPEDALVDEVDGNRRTRDFDTPESNNLQGKPIREEFVEGAGWVDQDVAPTIRQLRKLGMETAGSHSATQADHPQNTDPKDPRGPRNPAQVAIRGEVAPGVEKIFEKHGFIKLEQDGVTVFSSRGPAFRGQQFEPQATWEAITEDLDSVAEEAELEEEFQEQVAIENREEREATTFNSQLDTHIDQFKRGAANPAAIDAVKGLVGRLGWDFQPGFIDQFYVEKQLGMLSAKKIRDFLKSIEYPGRSKLTSKKKMIDSIVEGWKQAILSDPNMSLERVLLARAEKNPAPVVEPAPVIETPQEPEAPEGVTQSPEDAAWEAGLRLASYLRSNRTKSREVDTIFRAMGTTFFDEDGFFDDGEMYDALWYGGAALVARAKAAGLTLAPNEDGRTHKLEDGFDTDPLATRLTDAYIDYLPVLEAASRGESPPSTTRPVDPDGTSGPLKSSIPGAYSPDPKRKRAFDKARAREEKERGDREVEQARANPDQPVSNDNWSTPNTVPPPNPKKVTSKDIKKTRRAQANKASEDEINDAYDQTFGTDPFQDRMGFEGSYADSVRAFDFLDYAEFSNFLDEAFANGDLVGMIEAIKTHGRLKGETKSGKQKGKKWIGRYWAESQDPVKTAVVAHIVTAAPLPPEFTAVTFEPEEAVAEDEPPIPTLPPEFEGPSGQPIFGITALVQLAKMLGSLPRVDRKLRTAFGYYAPADGSIQLMPGLLRDPLKAARTIAHEIGHLIDDIQATLGDKLVVKLTPLIDPKVIFKDIMKFSPSNFDAVFRDELIQFSKYWRGPMDTGDNKYFRYRMSDDETWADFLSGILVNPDEARRIAPRAFAAFFKAMDQRPELQAAYDTMVDLLRGEHLAGFVRQQTRANMKRGRRRILDQLTPKSIKARFFTSLSQAKRLIHAGLFNKYWKSDQVQRKDAGGRLPIGGIISDDIEVASTYTMRNTYEVQSLINRFVLDYLEENGATLDDLGEYLFIRRVLDERRYTGQWIEENPVEARQLLQIIANLKHVVGPNLGPTAMQELESLWDEVSSARDDQLYDVAAKLAYHADVYNYADVVEAAINETGVEIKGAQFMAAWNVRGKMSNPEGIDEKMAKEMEVDLEKEIGVEKMAVVREATKRFFNIFKPYVMKAVNIGLYNREVAEEVILPNINNYFPFMVIDYFNEGDVSAAIKEQKGTNAGIIDPVSAMSMQFEALIRWIQRQEMATLMIENHQNSHAPTVNHGAQTVWNRSRMEALQKKEQDNSFIGKWINGRKYIYELADQEKSLERSTIHEPLGALLHTMLYLSFPFRMAYTVLSPKFWMNNTVRDFLSTAEAISANPFGKKLKPLVNLARSFMVAHDYYVAEATGRAPKSDLLKRLIAEDMIVPPSPRLTTQLTTTQGVALEEAFINHGLLVSAVNARRGDLAPNLPKKLSIFLREVLGIGFAIRFSAAQEARGKAHAYLTAADEWGANTKRTRDYTRRMALPKPAVGGNWTLRGGGLMLFLRPIMMGWRRSENVLFDTPDNPGVVKKIPGLKHLNTWHMARLALIEGVPRILPWLVTSGLLYRMFGMDGDDDDAPFSWAQSFYRKLSPYAGETSLAVPIGFMDPHTNEVHYMFAPENITKSARDIPEHWTAVYLNIPSSEEGRIYGNALHRSLRAVDPDNLGVPDQDAMAEAVGFVKQQVPSLSPAIEMAGHLTKASQGHNSEDSFFGTPVYNKDYFDAGGDLRHEAVVAGTIREFGMIGEMINEILVSFGLMDRRAADRFPQSSKYSDLQGWVKIGSFGLVRFSNYEGTRIARGETLETKALQARIRAVTPEDANTIRRTFYKIQQIDEDDRTANENTQYALTKHWLRNYWNTRTKRGLPDPQFRARLGDILSKDTAAAEVELESIKSEIRESTVGHIRVLKGLQKMSPETKARDLPLEDRRLTAPARR